MTKKFDAFFNGTLSLLSEAPVGWEGGDLPSDQADLFKGGKYGEGPRDYKMTAQEVSAVAAKLKEALPSKLPWEGFRDDVLVRIIKEVKPKWVLNNTMSSRAARVIYSKLRELGVVKDERDGYIYGSTPSVPEAEEAADEISAEISAEVLDAETETPAPETPEADETEASEEGADTLTPKQEAIFNFVQSIDGGPTKQEVLDWIERQYSYNKEELDDAKMDLTALLGSKILVKQGDKIVVPAEKAPSEDDDVEALEAPVDDEESFIRSYMGADKAPGAGQFND